MATPVRSHPVKASEDCAIMISRIPQIAADRPARDVPGMSALLRLHPLFSIATNLSRSANRDLAHRIKAPLFDHLVGARQQRCRHFEAERLGGLEIDHQLVFCRGLHGKVGSLFALEDAIDVAGGAAELIEEIHSIADETAYPAIETLVVDCGQ